ncbi:helix-turn-helix domain-containing protein [Pseudomonas panipatensis]|uniref:helix-turn-helix domain-containing protein n=1 Tax=Pseudomonas panipatensis TaxID=428992 RepID=UPI0035B4F98E
MVSLGERLLEERVRLAMTQEDFGALAGVTRKTQRLYESGERVPDANYLAAVADAGVDLLYVVAGRRAELRSNATLPVAGDINTDRLARIVEMLETFARSAGKRWPSAQLVAVAAEVYNVLLDEPALDEPKVERILKLVVNR